MLLPGLIRVRKKAPAGAFFRCVVFVFLWLCSSVWAAECSLLPYKSRVETVQVESIYDGDTLILQDGRRVRLLGINTPELARSKKEKAQPLGLEAKQQLQELLGNDPAFILVDKDPEDHYGRVLAHLFDDRGDNVVAKMLQQGMGFAVVIPPNDLFEDCYIESERLAIARKRGVWGETFYQPQSSDAPELAGGYARIRGEIEKVTPTRKVLWVDLKGQVTLKIEKKYLPALRGDALDAVITLSQGRSLTTTVVLDVRGWMTDRSGWKGKMQEQIRQGKRKRFQMNVQHRSAWAVSQ